MKPRRRRLTGVDDEVDSSSRSKRKKNETPNKKGSKTETLKPFARSYFEEVISEAGLLLSDSVESDHRLSCEPFGFLTKLEATLRNNVDFPRNVVEFAKGFDLWIADDESLESILAQNVLSKTNEETAASECVLRLLIRVECLQESLVASVTRRAVDLAISDRPDRVRALLKPFTLQDNMTAESALVEGLKEILNVSERAVRLEVITYLPDLITERHQGAIVTDLCKLMTEDAELTPAILDCLSYFNLPDDIKSRVTDEMLTALRVVSPIRFFPNLVNFFFIKIKEHDDVANTVRSLREGLDWTGPANSADIDVDSSQILTMLSLKTALMKSKTLNAEWLKVINRTKPPETNKPLDIAVLLAMYSLGAAKSKAVENVFKKRIKNASFGHSLLNETLKCFKPVIKEYAESCLMLSKTLLACKNDSLLNSFGAHWITILFEQSEDSRRMIISELIRQDADDDDQFGGRLTILLRIGNENIASLQPFSLQILSLVDKIEALNARDVGRLMDLLCLLAFKVENSNLEDDIRMLIQKQLSSTNSSIKCRGISSGIMAVKHIACSKTEKEPVDENESMHLDDLPEGKAKEAALIVKLILKSTSKFPDVTRFFYDRLAEMLQQCQFIDGEFLTWILNGFTNDFQNIYVVDINSTNMEPTDDIKLSQQFCLDAEEEVTNPIGLNMGGVVFGENVQKVNLQLLPSWFRVIQHLHKKAFDGKLLTIDALLGCAVVMPVVDDDVGLEEFNANLHDKILNCFVYCIDWFRELISAFASQDDPNMKRKTLGRLNDLILLEKRLCVFLNKTSIVYQPPISTFGVNNAKSQMFIIKDVKVKKNTKKGGKKKETEIPNETLQSQANSSIIDSQAKSVAKCKLNNQLFRSIQFDVLSLLKEKLYIEDDESVLLKMNMDSLLFLLDEVNPKLSQIFPSRVAKENPFKPSKTSEFFDIDPVDTLNRCLMLLPKLCQHMESIAEYTHKIIEYNDGVKDAIGLFTEQNAKAQLCLTGLLQIIINIFSWIGFRSHDNITKLKDGLKILSIRKNAANSKLTSLKELIIETSKYIMQYKDYCLLISTAANLLKFFEILVNLIDDHILYEKFMNLSLEMLSQSWRDVYGNPEKGLAFNQNVNSLLNGYFAKPNIGKVKNLSLELNQECVLLQKKNYVLEKFQCINKANFPLLFRSMCRALYESTKNEINKGLTDKQHLELWKDVSVVMKFFTDILKSADNRTNLGTFLKQSIPILKLFLSQGMPMMNIKLRSDPDSVVEILRTLQHTTRFLHSLYCHSRVKKDTALIAYLPQMKLILETLVYKVKESLAVNNCSEAFWMGNLKNKNLQGELIPSQTSTQTEESDNEDQLPEDDGSLSGSDNEDDELDMKSVSSIV